MHRKSGTLESAAHSQLLRGPVTAAARHLARAMLIRLAADGDMSGFAFQAI